MVLIRNDEQPLVFIGRQGRQFDGISNEAGTPGIWMKEIDAPALCFFTVISKWADDLEPNGPILLNGEVGCSLCSCRDPFLQKSLCDFFDHLRFSKWSNSWQEILVSWPFGVKLLKQVRQKRH